MSVSEKTTRERTGRFSAIAIGSFALGFAASGFFDGILLHQLLQWHHLLSGLQGEGMQDLRFQVIADGTFHAAMYLVAGFGIWFLWRHRQDLADPGSGRVLAAAALAGFGAWHIVDAIVVHWVLGLHHIRMEENWLFWDLLWVFLFGLLFIAAAWLVWRRGNMNGTGRGAAVVLIPVALLLSAWAMVPPAGTSSALVLFPAETPPARAFAIVQASGAKVLWTDASQGIWVVDDSEADFLGLYRRGALFVSPAFLPADCLDWSEFEI